MPRQVSHESINEEAEIAEPKRERGEVSSEEAAIAEPREDGLTEVEPEAVDTRPGYVVMHMGVGQWRFGETIPAAALSRDQVQRLLDMGAIAPADAVPPTPEAARHAADARGHVRLED